MDNSSILVMIVLFAIAAAVLTFVIRARLKRKYARREALRQHLRNITYHDNAKIERLIAFEREELKRKGLPEESLDGLMERAIDRWVRHNKAAAPLY